MKQLNIRHAVSRNGGYNSLENPIGIETGRPGLPVPGPSCYNSLENPIGIETSTVAIGKAEALLGKGTFDDCCEVAVKDLGATVEYERPGVSE